jgi:predicted nucleotidyltransferase
MGTIQSAQTASSSLADALFPKVRQRVLGVLFGNVGRSFYANEVIALAQSGTGAVQRELVALAESGLLTVTKVGNQRHYQANANSPLFAELRGLVLKTVGLADVLRTALAPLAGKIEAAFIYGSVAKQQDTAQSDIDVLIVSADLGYADVFGALETASTVLSRKINPTLYTPADLAKRIENDNAFVTKVLSQPKIWLIGDEEAFNLCMQKNMNTLAKTQPDNIDSMNV